MLLHCLSVHLSICLWCGTLWQSGSVYGVENCTIVFLGQHFLFTASDTFAVGRINSFSHSCLLTFWFCSYTLHWMQYSDSYASCRYSYMYSLAGYNVNTSEWYKLTRTHRFAIFDHHLLSTNMLLEIRMWFTTSIIIFCKWNFWIFLLSDDKQKYSPFLHWWARELLQWEIIYIVQHCDCCFYIICQE